MTALVTDDDVTAALLRPLTTTEQAYIDGLIGQSEAKLRARVPNIDDDIALWASGSRTPPAVSAAAVSAMLAQVIKRVLTNPRGLWSSTDTTGPLSHSETYPATRGGAGDSTELPGRLTITDADLAELWPTPMATGATIRTRLPHWCLP